MSLLDHDWPACATQSTGRKQRVDADHLVDNLRDAKVDSNAGQRNRLRSVETQFALQASHHRLQGN